MEGFGRPVRVSVWCLGVPFQSKSQKAILYQRKIFKMKAQAVSKAGIKIERFMEENRKIRNKVKELISIFQG
jgi:DNA topoisomerase VI subunit B